METQTETITGDVTTAGVGVTYTIQVTASDLVHVGTLGQSAEQDRFYEALGKTVAPKAEQIAAEDAYWIALAEKNKAEGFHTPEETAKHRKRRIEKP